MKNELMTYPRINILGPDENADPEGRELADMERRGPAPDVGHSEL